MPEFFLELFSEEIPARMQLIAAEALCDVVQSLSYSLDLDADFDETLASFCGPRRIAVTANLPEEKKSSVVEVRGPREGAPEAALNGFLNKYVASRDDVVIENGFHILRQNSPSVSAREFVEANLPEYLAAKLRWPKSMRWGQSGDFTWIRPLRRIVCLLDGEIIPLTLGPVSASNITEGHRVLGSGIFAVSSSKDWIEKLNANYVIPDYHKRFNIIQLGVIQKADERGLTVLKDESLIGEVTDLVEWPVPLIGEIDPQFMSLPPEVRELSMKVNQKYFALRDADGNPAPYFAFVANQEAPDGGAAIIAGNERVLRARLSDARYFWELDLKTPLDALLPQLDKITFHAKIGSQGKRVKRIEALAKEIADLLAANPQEARQAQWAGLLCKADLVTGMVGEFPELQGIMGGYYAEKNPHGWDGNIVGLAIKTHYQPKGPNDAVPTGTVACAVALADKLDTLREFFRIGEKPTGSGDPYALRRAALGIIRIILENGLHLRLRSLLDGDESLFDFIIERLRIKLRTDGQRFDVLDAVLSAQKDDDLVRNMQRVSIISDFLQTDDLRNLIVAYRRVTNILRIEDGVDGPHIAEHGHQDYSTNEEYAIIHMLNELPNIVKSYADYDYAPIMTYLGKLRAPVDAFFDRVTVNDEIQEVRRKRLSLLARLRDTMHLVADFSKIAA